MVIFVQLNFTLLGPLIGRGCSSEGFNDCETVNSTVYNGTITKCFCNTVDYCNDPNVQRLKNSSLIAHGKFLLVTVFVAMLKLICH